MNKLQRTWKRLRIYERIALLVSALTLIALVILGFLSLLQLMALPAELVAWLMALLMVAQTVQQWRKNRKPALYCLATALVLMLFAVFVYFAM